MPMPVGAAADVAGTAAATVRPAAHEASKHRSAHSQLGEQVGGHRNTNRLRGGPWATIQALGVAMHAHKAHRAPSALLAMQSPLLLTLHGAPLGSPDGAGP